MKPKSILKFFILLSIIGIALSSYLTYSHYAEKSAICDALDVGSCSIVNTSIYSEIFGIPVAAMGIAWFIVLWVLSAKSMKEPKWVRELLSWNIIGMIFVGYFIFAEIQLSTICPLCTIVHVIVLITFLFSLHLRKKAKQLGIVKEKQY